MSITLEAARQRFERELRSGTKCPCCRRYGKIYRRNLTSAMARTLIAMYKHHQKNPSGWIHMISVGNFGLPSRDYGTLERWGLTRSKRGGKEDGNPNLGYYALTEQGVAFVEGRVRALRYIYTYNGGTVQVQEPEASETTSVHEALGNKFNYNELMGA